MTERLLSIIGEHPDSIRQVDGATGNEKQPDEYPLASFNCWLKFLAHEEFPRAKAMRPHLENDDLISVVGI